LGATRKNKDRSPFIVALGGNLKSDHGSPIEILKLALSELACDHTSIDQVSRFYETAAYPKSSQSNFANAAACGETELSPADLIAYFHQVEGGFDRQRDIRWGARTLDLDLVVYEQSIIPDLSLWRRYADHSDEQVLLDELVVPHPRAHKRDFVLRPISDVASDWIHPVLGKSFADIYQEAQEMPPRGYVMSILAIIE